MADSGPRKRQRTIKACEPCRQLKGKCDGERPCSNCTRFQRDCQYQQRQGASPTHILRNGDDVASPIGPAADKTTPKVTTSVSSAKNGSMDSSILDPEKARYFDASSAISFPRLLGDSTGCEQSPTVAFVRLESGDQKRACTEYARHQATHLLG